MAGEFDGRSLTWPSGFRDFASIDQAVRNAKSLASWLGDAIGESVRAHGILVIPGWEIVRRTAKPVKVLNPKEVSGSFDDDRRDQLTDGQIKRIVHQLKRRCCLDKNGEGAKSRRSDRIRKSFRRRRVSRTRRER